MHGRAAGMSVIEIKSVEDALQILKASRSSDERIKIEQELLGMIARQDHPNGFEAFYRLIHGRYLPRHAREWIEAIYRARGAGKQGVVIEAFRGSWKTTTLTVTYSAWWLGMNASKSVLLVQVGDDIAHDNTAAVASIIRDHPGWKAAFPNIVPDDERGWGAGGYEVKDNTVEYGEWRAMNANRKDPSLLGAGYKSREIIGKHPGLLIVDDIHDENNTASERELETVKRTLKGTILPTMLKETRAIFVGTPWVENDILAYMKATGEYEVVRTPVLDQNGEPVFGEVFGKAEIERARRVSGANEFARMYLLDLSASKNKTFRYMTYPHEAIRWDWVMVGGVDYAGTMNERRNIEGSGDYFAMAYVAKLPQGGAVVVDGVLDRCTQAQAEVYVKRAQEIFPGWTLSVVEGDGKGEEFIQVIRRNPGLRILPLKTGGKGKARRLEKEMSPWLENGSVRISSADTPFLNELRHELDTYPNCEHDDALDALYWALRGIPDVLSIPRGTDELPSAIMTRRRDNPFKELART